MIKLSFSGNSLLKNCSKDFVILKCSWSWKKSILQVLIRSLIHLVLTLSRPVELYDIKLIVLSSISWVRAGVTAEPVG